MSTFVLVCVGSAGAAGASGRVPGDQLWVTRYDGGANGVEDGASSLAASPDGSTVYVTGLSGGIGTYFDFTTIAYDAESGAMRWVNRYDGPANGYDNGEAVAVSRSGNRVFVTGYSDGGASSFDILTLAYDAHTGATLWVRRHNGPANGDDFGVALGAGSDVGSGAESVFVTGFELSVGSSNDYTTIAYDAATGNQRWLQRYNGPGNYIDAATSLAVAPDGSAVFVAGYSSGAGVTLNDYATIAYDSATGGRRLGPTLRWPPG